MTNITDIDNLIKHGDYQQIADLFNQGRSEDDKKTNRDYVRKVLKGSRNNEEIFAFAENFLLKREEFEKSLNNLS